MLCGRDIILFERGICAIHFSSDGGTGALIKPPAFASVFGSSALTALAIIE
jgi:hypothetical protein